MGAVQLVHKGAGGTADGVGRVIAAGQVAAVGHLQPGREGEVTVGEHRALIAGQQGATLILVGVVALQAVPVPDRLNVARIIEDFRRAGNGSDLAAAGRTQQPQHSWIAARGNGAVFVAPGAGG